MSNRPSVRTTTGRSNTRTVRCRKIPKRGARKDRRARRDRSAARVLLGRGIGRRTRPRREPVRSRLRPDPLPVEAAHDLAGALAATAGEAVEARRILRRPAAQFRCRIPADRPRCCAHGQIRGRRVLRARLRGHAEPAADPGAARQATRGAEAPRHRRVRGGQLRFKPEFLRSMGINYLDIGTRGLSAAKFNPDFSLRTRVLALQTGALNQLLSDAVLTTAPRFRNQGREVRPGAYAARAFCHAARVDLERVEDRRHDSGRRAATCSANICVASRTC